MDVFEDHRVACHSVGNVGLDSDSFKIGNLYLELAMAPYYPGMELTELV